MMMTRQIFDSLLLNVVDSALCSLGDSCQQAIYFHLEKTFSIEKQEIPEKIDEFDRSMKAIFQQGAFFLEKAVLQDLCQELGVKFESSSDRDFPLAIQHVREIALGGLSFVSAVDSQEVAKIVENAGGGAC